MAALEDRRLIGAEQAPPAQALQTAPTGLVSRLHPMRARTERFVQDVYVRAYGARPTEFPPLMLARVNADGVLTAACGIRFARDGFFSANYLDEPVAAAVSRVAGITVADHEIIEVTTLASAVRNQGLALLDDAIRTAWELDVSYGFFTTIRAFSNVMRRAGLAHFRVADAAPSRVPAPDIWGDYYMHEPGVFVMDDRPRRRAMIGRADNSVVERAAEIRRSHLSPSNLNGKGTPHECV